MGRVKLDIDWSEGGCEIYVEEHRNGRYSLSEEEYADYLAVSKRYEEWTNKLNSLVREPIEATPETEAQRLRRLQTEAVLRLTDDEVIAMLDQAEAA